MSADDVMLAMTLGGIGLTGAYFKAELTRWTRLKARDHRREQGLRALYVERFSEPTPAAPAAERTETAPSECRRGAAAAQSRCPFKRAA